MRKSELPIVPHEKLLNEMHYDPLTGVFTRISGPRTDRIGLIASTTQNQGYVWVAIGRKQYLAHRLAWFYVHGVWPKGDIDHANRNRSDNRLCNLREATRSQNNANAPASVLSKTGMRGVFYVPRVKKYRAQMRANGRRISLGYFETAEKASEAYKNAARQEYGEFAHSA